MNEFQQERWSAPDVLLLLNVTQAPMGRHIAHPQTGLPLCAVPGRCERWEEIPVAAFDPAAWLGCQDCECVLAWLIGEGDEVPPGLTALRQLLGEPSFGPQPLTDFLLQHDGQVTDEALALLPQHAAVTVWRDALSLSARGSHGTLIEAGITGHIFPSDDLVVLVTAGDERGTVLNLVCLDAQAAGRGLRCIITRDLGLYWDRALFHLQLLEPHTGERCLSPEGGEITFHTRDG